MAEGKVIRLNKVARNLNVGIDTVIEFLAQKGHGIERSPNTKITPAQYALLAEEYADSAHEKEEASGMTIGTQTEEDVVITSKQIVEREKKQAEPDKAPDILITDNTAPVEKEKVASVNVPETAPQPERQPSDDGITAKREKLQGIKVLGKIDLKQKKEVQAPLQEEEPKAKPAPPATQTSVTPPNEVPSPPTDAPVTVTSETPPLTETPETTPPAVEQPDNSTIKAKAEALSGLKVVGKIELKAELPKSAKTKNVGSSEKSKAEEKGRKRPRKRIVSGKKEIFDPRDKKPSFRGRKKVVKKEELSEKEIQDKIKNTLLELNKKSTTKISRAKYRKEKRAQAADAQYLQEELANDEAKTLKVTEFISANDLASLMDVSVNAIISACMSLGMFVSINQRLDAEAITIIADEFGFSVDFTTQESELEFSEEEDTEDQLQERAPIVTIMGHVDHGKTSLLDHIRDAKVTSGEAGGITQHIGAYDVMTESGKKITFLDTPGHEAFTAMRARGAKITDIVIVVVAADDDVMPQTKEALNHAKVANVPIIIAISKIDKPNANPDKIKEALSAVNVLVEEWGGKYQCQEISAKTGQGVDELLDKVLLESELLELKANPNKKAFGSVIEASLDKGRGYVTTMMVQAGTLNIGHVVLAGAFFGKVKAMFNHQGKKLKQVGPSTPVQILGLDGAPQAGEKFIVLESDREAREAANKREQILREQNIRTKKHITLDEIGRRLAIGTFKELNLIVKGDVDGSVEALSGSLLKLSNEEVQVNIIHKGVGQISESDVLLASASDAIVIGFQVRPSAQAKKISEKEEVEIRRYSIIYDAINEIKDAMEGLLAPTVEEIITGNIEVREIFKISKVGTVAGCYVTDGYVKRTNQIRLVRGGIVMHEGEIDQLKRFKEQVTEVKASYECGISIKSFNDIQIGDVIEGFEQREVKRSL